MRLRLLWLALLFVGLATISASAGNSAGILYDNGVVCPGGCMDAWELNMGFAVSDSFFATANSRVTGFDIWVWEDPGDRMLRLNWQISSGEFGGGTLYGQGTTLVQDSFIAVNEYGFDIDKVTLTGLSVNIPAGTSWLTLDNAVTADHNPVYWDENSGVGCHSQGCPSQAEESQFGTIPSETFDIRGFRTGTDQDGLNTSPEPSSLLMLASGVLALGAVIRRRPR
ncbi:MAG TPA: PEP-CTERM sorting domain-containing protein [Terriglobales bacterium]|nr:PEP-CTERM sorting domain-containing protein [Terriglobales bacterium]